MMLFRALTALVALPLLLFAAGLAHAEGTKSYSVDARSSTLKFTARSMVGSASATMAFKGGTIVTGPTGQILTAQIVVDAASLSGSGLVHNQLAGRSGFDIASHPEILFRATEVTQRGSQITIAGELTMRGVTQPSVFAGTISGPNAGLIALTMSAELDRTKWGLTAGRPLYSRKAKVAIQLNAAGGA